MRPYFFIDIEFYNKKESPGNMILNRDFVELVVDCLKNVKWDLRFFKFYHSGEFDRVKGNKIPGLKLLKSFNDIIDLVSNKKTIYLFSNILNESLVSLNFEENRYSLNINNNHLTFEIPYWSLINKEFQMLFFKTEFNPVIEFEAIVLDILEKIKESDTYLLRRANIRVLGLEYRKFRPSFDGFFLMDSSIYEVYHTKEFSSGYKMPDYIEKLVEIGGFTGIKREKKGDYIFLKWLEKVDFGYDPYLERLQSILSKRHIWLSTTGIIPQSNSFNEFGDVELWHIIPVKPEKPFIMNQNTAFIEIGISESNVYSIETRELLNKKIEEISSDKNIKAINVITENRNASIMMLNQSLYCLDYDHSKYDIDNKIKQIFYRDKNNKIWSYPTIGKWINNSTGVMVSIPANDIMDKNMSNITISKNYAAICSYSIITCFKRSEDKFIPIWMIWNCMHATVNDIDEKSNKVKAAEGFMDLTAFEVELLSGTILNYGENPGMESMRLVEIILK